LCSLFWKRTTRAGAVAGMIAGFATAILWTLQIKEHFYDLYEMIPGFAVGFAVTIIVSLMTEPPAQEIQDEFDEIRRSI
jgi:sodium/proline symporter